MLVDEGEVIPEATCIIEHLQARHPRPERVEPGRRARPQGPVCSIAFSTSTCRGTSQPSVNHALRPERAVPTGTRRASRTCGLPTTGSRDLLAERLGRGRAFTMADCAAAPSLFYADWVERDRRCAAKLKALSRPAARASCRCASGRRGAALPPLFPARSARPRLSEGRRLRQELIGLDHRAEACLHGSGRRHSCPDDQRRTRPE